MPVTPKQAATSRMSRRRAACLIGVHLLFVLHVIHWKVAGRTLAPIEPSEMFDTLHLGVVTVGFLFTLGAVIGTAIAGRFFCGWGCHILALQDLCAWLLNRLSIPTRPIRSRTLVWIPALAALYLFAWPQATRWWAGDPLPPLHVVTDPEGWTSFTTPDLLRSFPGPWMTAATLGICGFAIVYFLGSRSFCRYACPYGALFAVAERAAPLRIVAGPGECATCGRCIASCKSNVQVITEIKKFGAVVDPNCFRDLDCVSVCPSDALRLGLSLPPVVQLRAAPRPAARHYDFSRGEDALMGLVVLIALPIIRGLYDAVSFLLALALCALLAWGAVIGLRLARQERVVVGRRALKEGGSLTWAGWGASAILLGATALTGQAGIVRYHLLFGNAALRELAGDASDSLEKPPPGAAGASPRALNSSAPLDRAIRHFEQAAAWGLVQPRSLTLRLAALDLQAGSPAKARDKLNALVADDPHDPEARLLTARAWIAEGRAAIASQCLESLIRDERVAAPSRDARRIVLAATAMLADVAASAGRYEEALRHYEGCLSLDSRDAGALMGRGVMLAAVGRHAEAAESFRNILDQDPRSAGAHNNLAASLVRLDQPQEALAHYQRALEIVPDHPVAASNAAQLLLDAGRLDAAESLFQRILKRNSADAAAEAGIAEIRRRRAQAGDPGGMDR